MSTRDALRLMDFDTPYKERLKSTHVIQDDKNTARREAALRLLAKRDVDAQQQASKHNSSNDNNNSSSNHSSSDLKIKKDLNRNELDMAQYMKKLFSTYGNGDTMTLEGFERMMDRLGLLGELSLKLDKNMSDEHKIEKSVTTAVDVERIGSQNATCVQREEIVRVVKSSFQLNPTMDNNTFKWACPAILYSMISENCMHEPQKHLSSEHLDNHQGEETTNWSLMWWYSNGVVFLISACGVLGLAVIPIMQKRFYEQLLQFLVALAVGTLAGDALLHLLPHAMTSSHGHDHHGPESNMNMWKGCVAMLGLVFFFFMERMITIAAKWRKTRQLKDKLPKRLKVMNKEGSTQLTNASEKQCKHKYSSFPYCYDEIKMVDASNDEHVFRLAGGTDNVESRNNTQTTTIDDLASNSDIHSFKNANILHNDDLETNQNLTECPNDITSVTCTGKNKMLDLDNKDDSDSVEYTVILREHENRHHGHTHAHGHVHAAPKTMFSVAWMVIMGDGLHNFTDGMAIGAAFSNSLAGGLSTALAVFCHELPHELGDFAMLLKAGMSAKQALFYNLLSSVLCFMGNWVGLRLGNIEYASSWVFAAAAGMFLYIALVDMIPELSSGHDGEGTLFKCCLHLSGLLLGFGIMTVIALYEHDLETVFHQD
ncbi:ZIP Zinc transporter [Popillia japonica]|uniref:ZIP Zinc transporter n=1 Tax=Popillia japonica TaxID=7064 RepID=A0AAW1HU03_POPJA